MSRERLTLSGQVEQLEDDLEFYKGKLLELLATLLIEPNRGEVGEKMRAYAEKMNDRVLQREKVES